MEVKRDILWRVYLSFIGIVAFALLILGRVVYIQQVQGAYWKSMAQKQQQRFQTIEAERGTIYSEDGNMLSTSIPVFDIYVDFGADGLREHDGKRFFENLDSLSMALAGLFPGSARDYRRFLEKGYRSKDRYTLLQRNVSFRQYQALRRFPLIRLGKNKSGFIAEVKPKRLNPYGLLANRTIGLSREYIDSDGKIRNTNVGIEDSYDSVLKGESGKRLVKYLAGGVFVPVEGSEIEPENGRDIITTIDVNVQDIAENALLRMMQENECDHGTCIVMEVKTGKIKAIANLGRTSSGNYWETRNYALVASEPGSTFKLATMLSLLEDGYVRLTDKVNLEGGEWKVNRRTVYDAESHGLHEVTVQQAFEHSSNVGMAKLTMAHYSSHPADFIGHLQKLGLNRYSGIDIRGETPPVIKTPASRTWSATTLPWMSFGYEVMISPLQTLMLYNAVANDGVMMKPYLVNAVQQNGQLLESYEPRVKMEEICSKKTLSLLQQCLKGVCNNPGGTGYNLFKGAPYTVAGKTGTALVADGNRGYANHIYQSSFAGYFPADDPVYSCIVVIKNKPFAKKFYGASVAGPVFKEIADKLYALQTGTAVLPVTAAKGDSTAPAYVGSVKDIQELMQAWDIPVQAADSLQDWAMLKAAPGLAALKPVPLQKDSMPDLRGMGLKDALYLLEKLELKVNVRGRGRVIAQSLAPGTFFKEGQKIMIELN